MTETIDIVKAIVKLAERIQKIKQIHTGLLAKGFKRPSILIDPQGRKIKDASRNTVFVTETIRILTIAELSEHGLVDNMQFIPLQNEVMALFDSGKLLVGSRQLNVTLGQPGREADASFLDLTVEFFDARKENSHEYPLMEAIITDINKTKG